MEKDSNAESHLYDISQPLHNQLKTTARVALSISVFATLVLLTTLFFLFEDQQQGSYLSSIQAFTRSQDQLVPAMLIGGAMIMLMAGMITWFILLYSSARIAGPMYRFSRNVEMQINQGPVSTIKLRKGDYLQDLSGKLAQAAEGLNEYYADQLEVVDEVVEKLESSRELSSTEYNEFLQRLENRVNR